VIHIHDRLQVCTGRDQSYKAKKLDVRFGKHGDKNSVRWLLLLLFTFIATCAFHALYRGWHQVHMHEECKCSVLIKYTVWQYYFVFRYQNPVVIFHSMH